MANITVRLGDGGGIETIMVESVDNETEDDIIRIVAALQKEARLFWA